MTKDQQAFVEDVLANYSSEFLSDAKQRYERAKDQVLAAKVALEQAEGFLERAEFALIDECREIVDPGAPTK